MPSARHGHTPRHAAPFNAAAVRAAATASADYQPRHGAPDVVVTRGGMDRPDIRFLPLTGPQSPGEAW